MRPFPDFDLIYLYLLKLLFHGKYAEVKITKLCNLCILSKVITCQERLSWPFGGNF
jgi:hypothetical protein